MKSWLLVISVIVSTSAVFGQKKEKIELNPQQSYHTIFYSLPTVKISFTGEDLVDELYLLTTSDWYSKLDSSRKERIKKTRQKLEVNVAKYNDYKTSLILIIGPLAQDDSVLYFLITKTIGTALLMQGKARVITIPNGVTQPTIKVLSSDNGLHGKNYSFFTPGQSEPFFSSETLATDIAKVVREPLPVEPEEIHTPASDSILYTIVEKMPEYPTGYSDAFNYFKKKITCCKKAVTDVGARRIFLGFIVERDGSITHPQISKPADLDPNLAEAIKRLATQMPPWIPGRQNNRAVRVRFMLPVKLE